MTRDARNRVNALAAVDVRALESLPGVTSVQLVGGGRQNRGIYRATSGGQPILLKVLQGDVDAAELAVRAEMLRRLRMIDASVCGPVPVGGRLVNEVTLDRGDRVYVLATDYAVGSEPCIHEPRHVALMGGSLARLHSSMASLPPLDMPPLRAFQRTPGLVRAASELGVAPSWIDIGLEPLDVGPTQLLHGDFNSSNMRLSAQGIRIFDFEDSGYGSREEDVALAIYTALFDSWVSSAPGAHDSFRASFLDGYASHAERPLAHEALEQLVSQRVLMLGSWLLAYEPPIGIRSASPAWKAELRRFVEQHFNRHMT